MTGLTLDCANPVVRTLLIPLHVRRLEANHPDPLVRDPRAVEIAARVAYDPAEVTLRPHDRVTTLLRLRHFDRRARDFLARVPNATLIQIGCGLDTRFDRLDNGRLSWFDLDLPAVIDLRRKLISDTERCRMIAGSVLDTAWLEAVGSPPGPTCLFLAEGVLPYLEPDQVRWIVRTLRQRFPGCEFIFDAMTPDMLRLHQLELRRSKIGALLRWALSNPQEVERWADGVQLIQAWYYFDQPEARLGAMQLLRFIPLFARGVGVFHYRLGAADERD